MSLALGCYTTFLHLNIIVILLLIATDIHPNPGPLNEPRTLGISHANVHSLRAHSKLDELKIMADLANIDIITISETWLKDTDNDISFQTAGFQNIIRCDRTKLAVGGVAVYCHDNINFAQRYDLCPCILPDDSSCVWIEVCLDKCKLLIGTYYRLSGQSAQNKDFFL